MRWVSPPGWPEPPLGWQPTAGWQPDVTWPPPPPGWNFWHDPKPPARRKAFRGWATSMLPTAPPTTPRPGSGFAISRRRGWAEALGVFALFFAASAIAAAFYQADLVVAPKSVSVSQGVLSAVSYLADAGLAIVVVVALTRLRGLRISDIGIAPKWATHRAYRWQGLGVGLMFVAAVTVSSLMLHLASPHAKYPFLTPNAWHLLYEIPHSIAAGVTEELVVLAFFITVLEQARVRPWAIYVAGVALRLSYHVYYGPGVIMFGIWAVATIWLFRRTRRVMPLIIAHAVYDCVGVYFHEVPKPPVAVAALLGWLILGTIILVIVRAIQIASRGRRPASVVTR